MKRPLFRTNNFCLNMILSKVPEDTRIAERHGVMDKQQIQPKVKKVVLQ